MGKICSRINHFFLYSLEMVSYVTNARNCTYCIKHSQIYACFFFFLQKATEGYDGLATQHHNCSIQLSLGGVVTPLCRPELCFPADQRGSSTNNSGRQRLPA